MSKPMGENMGVEFYNFLELHILPINYKMVSNPQHWRENELFLYRSYYAYCQRLNKTPLLLKAFREELMRLLPDKILQKRGSGGGKDNYWLGLKYIEDGVFMESPLVRKILSLSQPFQYRNYEEKICPEQKTKSLSVPGIPEGYTKKESERVLKVAKILDAEILEERVAIVMENEWEKDNSNLAQRYINRKQYK